MTLQAYRTVFVVFLAITILLLFTSVVLFLLLDIRKIISVKTGWAMKKETKLFRLDFWKDSMEKPLKEQTGTLRRRKRKRDFFVITEEKTIFFSDERILYIDGD